uniref:Putative secreted peptide n=1 Tax=Rhipicephalus pulchellus TaxID=72859 RepID=L7MCH5_RHIPC
MNAYAILTLLILGHLCQIKAATFRRPAMATEDAKKLVTEKLSRSIMEHREELIEALQGIDSTGDETDDQMEPVNIAIDVFIKNLFL